MSTWIRVTPADNGEIYFWNLSLNETVWDEPEGCEVVWNAAVHEGRYYYWHTKTPEKTSWEQPLELHSNGNELPQPRSAAPSEVLEAMRHYVKPERGWQFVTVCQEEAASISSTDDAEAEARRRRKAYNARFTSGQHGGNNKDSLWVEVHTKQGEVYYWDYRGMMSTSQMPAGANATYQAFETPNSPGVFYYQDVKSKEVRWSLPGMSSCSRQSWIEPGTAITINECRDVRYMGQVGTVVFRLPHEMVAVKLPEQLGDVVVEVLEKHLAVLRKGTHVELHGIEQVPTINGQVGTIDDGVMDKHSMKMKVRLPDDTIKNVKVTKMLPRSRLWEIDLWQREVCLQWRKSEQEQIFISEDGQHHYYNLHMPFGFLQRPKNGVPSEPWPLLVFMHGTGGGSFLSQSKKATQSVGIEYAASRFVIVSPKCTWTWKQTPKSWVAELARHLRACSWVDPEQMYLTGFSMGGMGTWEVGASMADVFAAIAPVAAHHKEDNNANLSDKLRKMPILAVHSTHDPTCPFQPEEKLWQKLRAKGNLRMQVCCGPHIDHCEVFDRAYCDSPFVFEWLLNHRRPALLPAEKSASEDRTIKC